MHALQSSAVVAVIGAGAMGAGIAQVAAQAGHPVKLYDNRPGVAAQAVAGIDRQLARLVEKGKLQPDAREAIVARLQPVEVIEALVDARLVIEAIVENLQVKQDLLRQLQALCAEDCILASNTSSLSITSLAAG
ncbi:MAG: 3-hydroxyacyl-CoA dehydrogenase NAD-binding domain-containing protein, partial [Pseudomonas sp.]